MYLLDANVFISAKNAHYGMDFAPGFWDWLSLAHDSGVLGSVEAVRDELTDGGDELAEWVKQLPRSFFEPVDAASVAVLQNLADWANRSSQYTAGAVATFLQNADYYLIGQAKALGMTVVTHEKASPDSKKRILIPDACNAMGVTHCLPWKMLREQGVRFTL